MEINKEEDLGLFIISPNQRDKIMEKIMEQKREPHIFVDDVNPMEDTFDELE